MRDKETYKLFIYGNLQRTSCGFSLSSGYTCESVELEKGLSDEEFLDVLDVRSGIEIEHNRQIDFIEKSTGRIFGKLEKVGV